jgi:hypothetical protein
LMFSSGFDGLIVKWSIPSGELLMNILTVGNVFSLALVDEIMFSAVAFYSFVKLNVDDGLNPPSILQKATHKPLEIITSIKRFDVS